MIALITRRRWTTEEPPRPGDPPGTTRWSHDHTGVFLFGLIPLFGECRSYRCNAGPVILPKPEIVRWG
jgi:hypothetical protein